MLTQIKVFCDSEVRQMMAKKLGPNMRLRLELRPFQIKQEFTEEHSGVNLCIRSFSLHQTLTTGADFPSILSPLVTRLQLG